MKLQKGDYLENLTEKQFNELMKFQPSRYGKYTYHDNVKSLMIVMGDTGNFPFIGMIGSEESITKLSFTEFKKRSINTFKS
jgi:hypothetical protein